MSLTPVADTTLMELTPTNNMGAVESIAVGVTGHGTVARALIRFDLTESVPANAVITEVELILPVVRMSALAEDVTFNLHRLKVSWGEGSQQSPGGGITGTGSAALPGEATWAARFHTLTVWQEGGGKAGDDYENTASASAGAGNVVDFTSTTALVADVQGWAANPGSNNGWLLKDAAEAHGTTTGRRLGSKESGLAAPTLVVTYTESNALRLSNVAVETGKFCFQFQAAAGKTYLVERQHDVSAHQWETLQTITPNSAGPVPVCDPMGTSPAFYRVIERP